MGARLGTLERDLSNRAIPVFERPGTNAETKSGQALIARIRAKRLALVNKAMEDPKALQESHPWEYRQFREDLGVYKDDFEGFASLYVPRIIEGLQKLRESSSKQYLDRQEWNPYFAAAKFSSAFAIWGNDEKKTERLYELLDAFKEAWGRPKKLQMDQERARILADDDDDDDWI